MASVWVLLVERRGDSDDDVALFWRKAAAEAAAAAYVRDRWPLPDEPPSAADDAIRRYNEAPGVAERLVLDLVEIEGHEHFDGEDDDRRRCGMCGEPVELANAADPESWVHAADANDWGDHTAEVDVPIEWRRVVSVEPMAWAEVDQGAGR